MFCPQCGNPQGEEIKFCKQCGANMFAVRQVVSTREVGERFDWSKTWVAEMFLSCAERKRREQELELQRGLTPEVKRYREIKGGVITASIGAGLIIVLYVLAQGIILGGQVPPDAVEIVRRMWIAGVIPVCVGLAILFNGLFISKKVVEVTGKAAKVKVPAFGPQPEEVDSELRSLRAADSSNFIPSRFSITEEATKQL